MKNKNLCSVLNCDKKSDRKKLCWAHRKRLMRKNSTLDNVPIKKVKNVLSKKCGNHLCTKIIHRGQKNWENKYCDDDCKQEARHWYTINVKPLKVILKSKTLFPHKTLPLVLNTEL